MYRKILVPLDGSALAECVLPHVQALVEGCHVREVVFMRVVEPLSPMVVGETMMPPAEVERVTATMISEAESYLKALVGRLKYEGVETSWQLKTGRVAETVADFATDHGVDLIIIATHGRSGVSRWVWGKHRGPNPPVGLRPCSDGSSTGLRSRSLITRGAEFHGLCPWVNGKLAHRASSIACALERVPRAMPVGIYEKSSQFSDTRPPSPAQTPPARHRPDQLWRFSTDGCTDQRGGVPKCTIAEKIKKHRR